MGTERIALRNAAFFDGFNLYHAIDQLGRPQYKWLDLSRLAGRFVPKGQKLEHVYYFSAIAHWNMSRKLRHIAFLRALATTGVEAVMGKFKPKDRYCSFCHRTTRGHEEKQTDVNLALYLLNEARKDSYDRAILVSNDSDLVPAVDMVRREFPDKLIIIVTPPGKRTSKELMKTVGGWRFVRSIETKHLDGCLLPKRMVDADGEIRRPAEYDPGSQI